VRHTHRLIALAVITAAAACGPFRSRPASERALLYFTNESLDQADVFAVVPGSDAVRIGIVFAGRTDTLVVPPGVVNRGNTINVVARLLARSNAPQTGPIAIHPGARWEVRLPLDAKLLVALPARQ
jgi:hypothetical protein